jgi:hypothetical protein
MAVNTITLSDGRSGEPGTLRVVQALDGVCKALEITAEEDQVDRLSLATAAAILAEMLSDRLYVP